MKMNSLDTIGFYTLSNERAKNASSTSPLWRCELILTDKCNFKCPYCRGVENENKGHLTWLEAVFIIDMWKANGLKNIRFSGGEPTLWNSDNGNHRNLVDLVYYSKTLGIDRIAVSTNGSADSGFYQKLIKAGANDFSVSLDACCSEIGDTMAGGVKGNWNKVVGNIRYLSRETYVTVGIVFTDTNIHEFKEIVRFASEDLGVSDIRILPSAQWNKSFDNIRIDETVQNSHPILNYRMNNYNNGRHVRGLNNGDSRHCFLALDDMAVLKGKHYPCIIYMRELGIPIGHIDKSILPFEAIKKIRKERLDWMMQHNVHLDVICKNNCLDVCVDYNNKFMSYKCGIV